MDLQDFMLGMGEQGSVEFSVQKLSHAFVALQNFSVNRAPLDEAVRNFGWMVHSDDDAPGDYLPERKIAIGERYGGNGIGTHGGGARCGLTAGYQIKGIGPNPLIGVDAPADYQHGGCAIFEGLQEALWGEIFHMTLPYGAARVASVIGSGTDCWWVIKRWGREALKERYGDNVRLPRGLIVREGVIRPAHFERAISHGIRAQEIGQGPTEAARVKKAISLLPVALPTSPRGVRTQAPGESAALTVRYGLLEMARRFAEQTAAARVKRLMHGSITPSNISLDGRWVDFGTATTFPFWGEVNNYDPFWDDTIVYARMFHTLCHSIKKNVPDPGGVLPNTQELCDVYGSVYRRRLSERFVCMAGFPAEVVSDMSATSVADLYGAMVAVAKAGQIAPYDPSGLELPDDDTKHSTYNLGECLFALSRSTSSQECEARLLPILGSGLMRKRLIATYMVARVEAEGLSAAKGVNRDSFNRFCVICAAKTARTLPLLYRAHMVSITEKIVLNNVEPDDLRAASQQLLSDTIDQVATVLADPRDMTACIWREGDREICFDAHSGAYFERMVGATKIIFSATTIGALVSSIKKNATEFWGKETWSAFHEV
jgi:hypothetical protein